MAVRNIEKKIIGVPGGRMSERDSRINSVLNALSRSQPVDFDKIKNIEAGYVAYLVLHGEKIIFAGSSSNLRARFTNMLMPKTTFVLYNKLVGELGSFRSAAVFLMKGCRYKVKVCESRPEAEAIEQLAIVTFNPLYNRR